MSDQLPVRVVEAEWTHDRSRYVDAALDIDRVLPMLGLVLAGSSISAFSHGLILMGLSELLIGLTWFAYAIVRRRRGHAWIREQNRAIDRSVAGVVGLVHVELRDRWGAYAHDFGLLTVSDEAITFEGAQTTFSLSPSRWRAITPADGGRVSGFVSDDWPDRRLAVRPITTEFLLSHTQPKAEAIDQAIRSAIEVRAQPWVAEVPPRRPPDARAVLRRSLASAAMGAAIAAVAAVAFPIAKNYRLHWIDLWIACFGLWYVVRSVPSVTVTLIRNRRRDAI